MITLEEFNKMLTKEEAEKVRSAQREQRTAERYMKILSTIGDNALTIKEIKEHVLPHLPISTVFTILRNMEEEGVLEVRYHPETLRKYYTRKEVK